MIILKSENVSQKLSFAKMSPVKKFKNHFKAIYERFFNKV